jgi:hypothetical protein
MQEFWVNLDLDMSEYGLGSYNHPLLHRVGQSVGRSIVHHNRVSELCLCLGAVHPSSIHYVTFPCRAALSFMG